MALTPLTVYYDASCPLCTSEMCALRERDRADALRLADCATVDEDETGVTRDAMMHALHARSGDGQWHIGVAAYVAIFEALRMRRAAAFARHHRLRPLLDRLYAVVARNRHRLPRRGLAWLLFRRRRHAGAP